MKNQDNLKQYTLNEVVELLERTTDRAQKIIKDFLYENLYHKSLFITVCKEEADLFSDCSLVTILETPLLNKLLKMSKRDIVAALGKIGVEAPKKILKAELPQWCQENAQKINNVIPTTYDISLVNSFDKARRKTYTYLKRKYEWDCYYNENMERKYFPYGSNQKDSVISLNLNRESTNIGFTTDKKYYFPDDDVTKLLTKYHCNRCLNRFNEVDSPYECEYFQQKKRF